MEERVKKLEEQIYGIAEILSTLVKNQNKIVFKDIDSAVEDIIKNDADGLKKEIEKSGLKKEIEKREKIEERVACIEAHIKSQTDRDNFQIGLPLSDFTLYKQWVIKKTGNHIGRDVTVFSMPNTSVRVHVAFSE